MTMLMNIFMCVLGIMFMFSGFFATGIRGGLSRGPTQPVSTAGRIIFFTAGAAVFVTGFNRVLDPQLWWLRLFPFTAVAIVASTLNLKPIRAYVAQRVTGKPDLAIRFNGRFPSVLVAMRVAFFAIVLAMFVFGLVPIPFSVAKFGIIACVVTLFALGCCYQFVEGHYVNTGRASVISLSDDQTSTE